MDNSVRPLAKIFLLGVEHMDLDFISRSELSYERVTQVWVCEKTLCRSNSIMGE